MNNKLAKLFLLLSMFFGTIMIFIIPPFNSPDEDSHFLYAYELSRGNLLPTSKGNQSGYYIPETIMEDIGHYKEFANDRTKKYKYDDYYFDQLLTDNYDKTKFVSAVVSKSPKIAYIAPATGIFIARHLKIFSGSDQMPVSVLLQFARFFSLLAYSIIGYFAIKLTPKFKKSFFVVMLMPLALFLRSMISYDGILLVIVALALANMLRIIDAKSKLTKKDYILFIITGFILLNTKLVYSIIFLCLFAIPKEVFGNNKKKAKSIAIIAGGILLLTIIKTMFYMSVKGSPEPMASTQIDFIIHNPVGYFKILVHNIIEQLKTQEYWMLGTLGYLDTYMPVLYVFLLKILLVTVFLVEAFHEKILLPLWLKIGLFLLVIFDIFGMYTMMYISWTPKVTNTTGGSEITGVQGRYFIPFLLLVPVIFNNRLVDKIKKFKLSKYLDKINTVLDNNIHYITAASLTMVVIILIMRYYC
ncbi:MAG: DUF2142 domain-containing protein [Bacilli bacterium]|nr:DUF2142 domain-containing protein [Bacilli bacterium]